MKPSPFLFALAGMMTLVFAACVDEEVTPDTTGTDTTNLHNDTIPPADTTLPHSVGGFDQNGASNARFTIGRGRTVRFSRGNLQFNATLGSHTTADGTAVPGTWRFAEHQYDYIGEANANISATYDGWIDLFGYGTSGWNSGALAYQPYSFYVDASLYDCAYLRESAVGDYRNADWGVFNAISNGGNTPGMWRTLTAREWDTLMIIRPNAADRHGVATIDSLYKGLVILPDEWQTPAGITFVSGCHGGFYPSSYSQNQYTSSEWSRMEDAGAIFLPASGYRSGMEYAHVFLSYEGCYWTSTHAETARSQFVGFSETSVAGGLALNWIGFSVRLVKD